MNKWELARYIIDAKKCIDSMMFISNNYKQLGNINLRERLDKLRQDFYINLGVVLEKNYKNNNLKIMKNYQINIYLFRMSFPCRLLEQGLF